MTTSSPPPEGVLIEEARESVGLSQNAAAEKAEISGTHWRTIVKGGVSMTSARGVLTLARMAKVVGATPEQLEQAGRPDVAKRLRAISPVARSGHDVDSKAEWDEIARLIAEYRRLVAEIIDRVPDRKRAQVGAAADLTVSLMEESTSADRSK